MRAVMFVGAALAFMVAGAAAASIRSDIQIMISLAGLFSGLIMLGIASVLGRLPR
jgi:hypothetical protein